MFSESVFQVAVLSGPCASTGDCVTSPNYPNFYGNDEACEIVVPFGKPLYVTHFATQDVHDVLTFGGQTYSGLSGPPQGLANPQTIQWRSDSSISSSGWQICTADGVKLAFHCGG